MTITITDTEPRIQYTVGGTSQSAFTVPFEFFEDSDLVVYDGTSLKTLTTDYTVTGGDGAGGTMTLVTAVSNTTITIIRDMPVERSTNFPLTGPFNIASLNTEMHKIISMIQQTESISGRTLKKADSDTDGTITLPPEADRASKFLAFDGNGDPISASGTSANLGPVSSFIDTLLDDGDAEAARATLGLGNIDLSTTSGIFSITAAQAAAWSGDATDTSWMEGVWFTDRLTWDDTYNILTRTEADKNDDIMGWCILKTFPGETVGGTALFRIQGTDTMLDPSGGNYTPPVGYPDRLIQPSYGSIGGWEMQQGWLNNGSSAMGGNGIEFDGNGENPYARVNHLKYNGKIYTGWVYNAYIDFSGVDEKSEPSFFWGLQWDEDGTGDRDFVQLYEAAQGGSGAGGAAITWTDVDRNTASKKRHIITQDPLAVNTVIAAAAHGLNATPTKAWAYLECKTAEHDYVQYDRVPIGLGFAGDAGSNGHVNVVIDAINAEVRVGATVPTVLDVSGGTPAQQTITAANWKLVIIVEE